MENAKIQMRHFLTSLRKLLANFFRQLAMCHFVTAVEYYCKNMDSKEENNSACEIEKSRIFKQLKFDDAYSSAFGIKSTSLIGRFVTFQITNWHLYVKKIHFF